ncbi:restriction endonuclease subunit S [Aeromonas hydrophila]|uniref:restriction endonuclease subunit S n=1 Tax=Aeromonas hydrophila TaxID=644 RepID=UPI002927BB38|nr:restriction endonuclease subunit S [Aeromonas hydrophila]
MAEQMMQNQADELVAKQTIPAGYKQTEVGVIPQEWSLISLNSIVDAAAPICYGVVQVGKYDEAGIPIIAIKFLKNISTAPLHRTSIKIEKPYVRSRLKKDDVLISIKGTIGHIGVVPEGFEGNISREIARVRLRDGVCSRYVAHLLEAPATQERISRSVVGTTRLEFSISAVREFLIPIPINCQEQKQIADVLSDCDALIAGLEYLISKKKAIKTATMQQLLTGHNRLPAFALRPDSTPKGYKSSELGQIPEDWDVLTYGDIYTFLSTATNSRADLSSSGDYGYIHYGDIHTEWNHKLDLSVSELPRVSRNLVSSSFVEDGDVIMADASEDYDGIGKSVEICNVGDDKIVSGLHTFLLRDKKKLLVDGYRGFLHSIPAVKKIFDRLATGMKVYGISKNNLIDIPVPLPPKQEQTAIATILSDMDSELAALEQKLAKARDVKQGMMQQLLTGRIRLPLPQEA